MEDAVEQVLSACYSSLYQVEGITVLGGEPTDQPEAIASFLGQIQNQGLSTMVYTGHVLNFLSRSRNPHIKQLLSAIDILVDGPFVPAEYRDDLMWVGSKNQIIHCLSSRYSMEVLEGAFRKQRKCFSISVSKDGAFMVSGLQSRDGAVAIEELLLGEKL